MTSLRSRGFPPVAGPDARILVLGSLPGRRSIEAGEYYAHSRNAFWPIMRELFGAAGDYDCRCDRLVECGIALWDVLESSDRPGSMDADIRSKTAEPNDFASFLAEHSGIERIGFNGKAAGRLFDRFVAPDLDPGAMDFVQLPSTSPAHARLSFGQKLEQWRRLLGEPEN